MQGKIQLDSGKVVTVHAKGLKTTTRGRVTDPAVALAPMSKSERRHVRKSLSKMGRRDLTLASLQATATHLVA